jgi:hypothetical protein
MPSYENNVFPFLQQHHRLHPAGRHQGTGFSRALGECAWGACLLRQRHRLVRRLHSTNRLPAAGLAVGGGWLRAHWRGPLHLYTLWAAT